MCAAPSDTYAFVVDIAVEAAERYKARKKVRETKERAIDEGKYTKAESLDRLAKRVNRLLNTVQAAVAAAPSRGEARAEAAMKSLPDEVHELVQRGPVQPEEINDTLVDRVIGATRDFLAVGFLERGLTASRAVCRIVTNLGDGRSGLGTGFMVTPSLLMTNHHVLADAQAAANSTAEFNYQLSGTGATLPVERFSLRPDLFFLNDKELDFALVGVAPRATSGATLASYGFCPLIASEGKILVRDPVNIVQHPKGELKQVVIRENKLLDLPEAPLDRFAHYEADTEQGSSGSPVFNDQWEIIALHHSGVPKTNADNEILGRDGNVWPPNGDPDDIDWIANEGIRTSRLVAFIRAAQVRDHEKRLQEEFIAISNGNVPAPSEAATVLPKPGTTVAPEPDQTLPPEPARTNPVVSPRLMRETSSGQPAAPRRAGTVSLTVPLTITIALGSADAAAVADILHAGDGADAAADLFEAAIHPDPNYSNRPGFNSRFLGFEAALPRAAASNVELKYYHYSVIMNAERKIAAVSAVNLDIGAPFQLNREGKDRWFFDPRIDEDKQIGNELYADNPLDRGHLTRRADAAWGKTEREAQLANDDTFHWTNCSPQHEVFNQSTKANQRGLLLWGTLENYVSDQAANGTRKLSVFNGPILRKNDRLYRGVRLPKEFYKLIAYKKDDGTPGAVAFILSQASLIKNLPAEDFEVGPYKPFQVKISDLQSRTNLNFGKLADYDPLRKPGHEGFMEGAQTDVIEVGSLRNISL